MKTVLLTGTAGFIGYQTAYALLSKGYHVIGLDNMNDYYDVRLKEYRLNTLKESKTFTFFEIDIEDYKKLQELFKEHMFDGVIKVIMLVFNNKLAQFFFAGNAFYVGNKHS